MNRQAALPLTLNPTPTFDNFIGEDNREALSALQHAAEQVQPGFISIWGAACTGKSHLLQAACNTAAANGKSIAYLPLKQLAGNGPGCLNGFEAMDLVCLDELDSIIDSLPWQKGLYELYNAVQQQGRLLIAASRIPPRELGLKLPDLKSRLGWGPCYHLQSPNDATKGRILQRLAKERGLGLPDEAVRYLLHRQSRDLHELLQLLEQLDRASLAAQRRLTVPFIREQLQLQ